MINIIIVVGILVTSGLACAEKSYRPDNTAMNTREAESRKLTPVPYQQALKT